MQPKKASEYVPQHTESFTSRSRCHNNLPRPPTITPQSATTTFTTNLNNATLAPQHMGCSDGKGRAPQSHCCNTCWSVEVAVARPAHTNGPQHKSWNNLVPQHVCCRVRGNRAPQSHGCCTCWSVRRSEAKPPRSLVPQHRTIMPQQTDRRKTHTEDALNVPRHRNGCGGKVWAPQSPCCQNCWC